MQGGAWSDEQVEELKALRAQGLSAGVIAQRLGGITRNKVIGKLDRLGLLGQGQRGGRPAPEGAPAATAPSAPAPAPAAPTPVRPAQPPTPRAMAAVDEAMDTLAIQARSIKVEEMPTPATPSAIVRDIQALTPLMCRWPLGDPQKPGFGFCGCAAIAGRPYCTAHAEIAYEPPRERRRA